MSGRAGRRGKDDRGIVIQMLDEKMDPLVAKGKIPACCHSPSPIAVVILPPEFRVRTNIACKFDAAFIR